MPGAAVAAEDEARGAGAPCPIPVGRVASNPPLPADGAPDGAFDAPRDAAGLERTTGAEAADDDPEAGPAGGAMVSSMPGAVRAAGDEWAGDEWAGDGAS